MMTPPVASPEAAPRGVVLAGGQSRRMGQDKARLRWGEKTLDAHMAALLRDAGCPVAQISGGRAEEGEFVPDAFPGLGPLGGVATLVQATREQEKVGWLFAPVDMPLLTPALLRRLWQEAGGATACFFGASPLPFFLRSTPETLDAAAKTAADLRSGRTFSVRQFLTQLAARALPCASEEEGALRNVNTPEDWAELEKRRPRP